MSSVNTERETGKTDFVTGRLGAKGRRKTAPVVPPGWPLGYPVDLDRLHGVVLVVHGGGGAGERG